MDERNYIYRYYQAIKDGSVTVGKWIELIYEYLVKGIEKGQFLFDQKKANNAIKFIEAKCHHSEGELAPETLKLELWQKAIVSAIFGIVDENGLRQFREVFILMGRKNGKSLFASAIIQYCIYADSEFGAKAFCVAPKLEQAEIVFNSFWQSVQLDSELDRITKSRKSDLYVKKTNSSVRKLAFNARKADGFNPHIVCNDEIAAWPGDKGLKQYEVMKSAVGARKQPLILSITTSGYENDGIFDELMKRATRFLLGDSKEKRFLPFLYMIDDVTKWNDINEIEKAMPNLSVSVPVDFMLEEIAIAESSLSKKGEFLTKYCCIKQSSSLAWLAAEVVEAACQKEIRLEDFRGSYAVGGIDLSQTVDLTACVVVIEKNGILNVFAQFFMPSEKIQEATERDGIPYNAYVQRGFLKLSGENFVDYEDCFAWFRALIEQYEIYPLQTGYDRYSSQYLIKDMENYGFHCDDVYQGENLFGVIQETEGLLKDKKINIGNNDLLKIHLLNSAIKMSTERNRGKLVKITPHARIDGCAALLDALTVRQKWYDEIGAQLKNEG